MWLERSQGMEPRLPSLFPSSDLLWAPSTGWTRRHAENTVAHWYSQGQRIGQGRVESGSQEQTGTCCIWNLWFLTQWGTWEERQRNELVDPGLMSTGYSARFLSLVSTKCLRMDQTNFLLGFTPTFHPAYLTLEVCDYIKSQVSGNCCVTHNNCERSWYIYPVNFITRCLMIMLNSVPNHLTCLRKPV